MGSYAMSEHLKQGTFFWLFAAVLACSGQEESDGAQRTTSAGGTTTVAAAGMSPVGGGGGNTTTSSSGAATMAGTQAGGSSGQSSGGTATSAGASGASGAPAAGGAAGNVAGSAGQMGMPMGGGGTSAGGDATGAGGASAGMGAAGMGGAPAAGGSEAGGAGGDDAVAGGGMSAAGSVDDGDCMTPPAPSTLVGWGTEGSGTTGGGNETPVVVTSSNDFSSNINGSNARVIYLNGSISGSFNIGSNKTVVGICGAQIQGHIGLSGSSNVILRNFKVVGNNCSDSPNDCSAGSDAIGVGGGANHLWFDHLDVSDGSDGNLDITQGSDFITVSWTKFSYSSRRTDPQAGASGHRFSNLIGASDTDGRDPGHLNITWHHNWWADNVDQRMPRSRRGQIHVFNNLFTASGNSYCTDAGQDAQLLVENNVYIGVNNPFSIRNNGNMRAVGNDFQNTTGTSTANGSGFTPTYDYQADPTSGLEDAIRNGAGPQD